MSRRKHLHGFRWRSLYQWHRVIGLTAAAFVLVLAVTGIALNHTERFGLDAAFVDSPVLLDWYGITAPEPVSFKAGDFRVTQIGERLYVGSTEVRSRTATLVGAVVLDQIVVAAVGAELILLTSEGQLIESLGGPAGVPAGMRGIGLGDTGQLVLRAAHGDYTADLDELNWTEAPALPATWSQPSAVPASLAKVLDQAYRGSGLTAERVILDIHSGRIIADWGVYVMDGAAILLIALSISGFFLWLKQKRKERQHCKNTSR